jgi:hypothetical protein
LNEKFEQKRKRGKPVTHKPVKCVETGKVYRLYIEAAADIGGSRHGVRKCAEGTQTHHHGKHYVFVDSTEE